MAHTQKRLRERFGLDLTPDEYHQMNRAIQNRDGAWFRFKESNSRTHWTVPFKGQQLPVVYLKSVGGICTVLPPDVLEAAGDD